MKNVLSDFYTVLLYSALFCKFLCAVCYDVLMIQALVLPTATCDYCMPPPGQKPEFAPKPIFFSRFWVKFRFLTRVRLAVVTGGILSAHDIVTLVHHSIVHPKIPKKKASKEEQCSNLMIHL